MTRSGWTRAAAVCAGATAGVAVLVMFGIGSAWNILGVFGGSLIGSLIALWSDTRKRDQAQEQADS